MKDNNQWSSKLTWIVIIVSGSLTLLLIGVTLMYELLFKPNAFQLLPDQTCVAVRRPSASDKNAVYFSTMEACIHARS